MTPPRGLRLLLIAPPLTEPTLPNLAVELLAAIARADGHDADTLHGALFQPPSFSGGAIHSLAAPAAFAPTYFGGDIDPYARDVAQAVVADPDPWPALPPDFADRFEETFFLVACEVEAMLTSLLDHVPARTYDAIGFSIGFDAQKLPAASIAKLLRARGETGVFVAGGTGCDSTMGPALLEAFPEFDYVLQGEADSSWPRFLHRLAEGRAPEDVPGLVRRTAGGGTTVVPELPVDEHFLLAPRVDYVSYLTQRANSAYADQPLILLFESSRGCWWGRKHHCSFCGIRSVEDPYRVRSAPDVVDTVRELAQEYAPALLYATDAIAPMEYHRTVWPRLAEHRSAGEQWTLFYETKSNLGQHHVARMAAAGVLQVQPGIESFSTNTLRAMHKGATALQQVAFLKWAAHYGVKVIYGLIVGTPGETRADVDSMIELVGRLHHLPPPDAINRLALHRFSPHFRDPQRFGIVDVRPYKVQELLYGMDADAVTRLCYELNYSAPSQETPEMIAAYERLQQAVADWRVAYTRGARLIETRAGPLRVITRSGEPGEAAVLITDALDAAVLDVAREPVSLRALATRTEASEDALASCVERLSASGYVVARDEHVLALTLPHVHAAGHDEALLESDRGR